MNEIFECPFCGRNNFKRKRGLIQHINRCKSNPDRTDVSDESRRKMSEAQKGRKLSDEAKQKISEANKKNWQDPEYRQKVCDAVKTVQNTPEYKQKMSEALKGRKPSAEARQKMSESQKKRCEDPEIRQKLSENNRVRWENPEEHRKQSERMNRPEVKQKLSETQKKRYEDPEERRKTGETSKLMWEDPELRQKRSELSKKMWENPEYKQKMSESLKITLNNPEVRQKIYETKKKNNSFHTSKIEIELKEWFNTQNIDYKTQYKNNLYPFCCDFYLPKYDMYIEIQGSWTHGFKPYDSEDEECQERLELWKSKNTDYYNNAINVWTIRDVKKRETAKINNLNWIEIFSKDLNECINEIAEAISNAEANIIQKHI